MRKVGLESILQMHGCGDTILKYPIANQMTANNERDEKGMLARLEAGRVVSLNDYRH